MFAVTSLRSEDASSPVSSDAFFSVCSDSAVATFCLPDRSATSEAPRPVRCIGPYPPVVLGAPAWSSQRDSAYETASRTDSGTPYFAAAALYAAVPSALALLTAPGGEAWAGGLPNDTPTTTVGSATAASAARIFGRRSMMIS